MEKENKIPEEPKRETYGYQDGGVEEESGWLIEGGEDAYYEALEAFNKQIES